MHGDTVIRQHRKIIFLNPRSAHVFQVLARVLSEHIAPSEIWTETSGVVRFESSDHLKVKDIPGFARYNRKNIITRLLSMLSYFFYVFFKVLFGSSKSLLFMVTMPPFLGVIGFLFKKIRKQKYVVLVYDILPDALVSGGFIKNGFGVKLWRRLNRVVLDNADAVITIGEYMAENLDTMFDASRTALGYTAVIHNWEDVNVIKPLRKSVNPFVKEHGLENKFIVIYSGNIGATHDVETLVHAAKSLTDTTSIQFVIIGEGSQKHLIEDAKKQYSLDNFLIMSYLPQDQLPYSLTAADISIVTIARGVEVYLVPCKFYSYLASGSAVIAVCKDACEVATVIRDEACGRVVELGDGDALAESILGYYENSALLDQAKANSRRAAVEKYSEKNALRYVDVVKKIYP